MESLTPRPELENNQDPTRTLESSLFLVLASIGSVMILEASIGPGGAGARP